MRYPNKIKMRLILVIWILFSTLVGFGQQYVSENYFPCDLNGDGIKDLIQSEQTFDDLGKNGYEDLRFRSYTIKAYLGSLQGPQSTPVWSLSSTDSVRNLSDFNLDFDLNQDGFKDLLAVGEIMGIHEKKAKWFIVVFYGSLRGTLSSEEIIQQIEVPERKIADFHFFDYNGDGFADLIVLSHGRDIMNKLNVNYKTQIMFGSQQGFSTLQSLELVKEGFFSFSCEDYNGDKRKDILLGYGYKGGAKGDLLYGRAKNIPYSKNWFYFSHPVITFTFIYYQFYFVGDVNGDGFNDEVIVRMASGNDKYSHEPRYTISLYPGSSDGLRKDSLLYYSFYNWKDNESGFGGLLAIPMGDFDGDGSADILIKYREYFPAHNREFLEPSNGLYKQNDIIWGGNPPAFDSAVDSSLIDFLHFNELQIMGIGDINGDKKDDLLLYNSKKQFVIYGNKERKFTLIEWKH
jgi:hypothetical protein